MKAEKFKNLAEKRVNNAIKQIRLIGNLSNTNSYEYTDEQVRKVFKTLDHELAVARKRFQDTESIASDRFEL